MRRLASGFLVASLVIASAPASASSKSALKGELGIGPVRGGVLVSQALESRLGTGVCAVATAVDITIDPSGYVDSVNLYAPMRWDVVNHRDPSGRLTADGDFESRDECLEQAGAHPSLRETCEKYPPAQKPGWLDQLGARWDALWDRAVTEPAQERAREVVERKLEEIAKEQAAPAELRDVVPEKVYPKQTFREGSDTVVAGASRGLKAGVETGAGVLLPAGTLARKGKAARTARLATKAVNLPAWRSVAIDTAHIAERHMAGGALTAGRTVFPSYMSSRSVERAVRQAYRFSSRIGGQGDRVLVRGTFDGLTIEIWVNRTTRMIETAYPVF